MSDMTPTTPTISLPPSVFVVAPSDDDVTAKLSDLRLQVQPRAVLSNAPAPSGRPDARAIAHALKALVPLNGDIRLKFSLDLRNLGDYLSLNLRQEVLRVLNDCLVKNAQRIGVQRVTRFPHPPVSVSDVEDCDLHYSVSPIGGLPEHHWFKDQLLAPKEPFVELTEMRIHLSWTKPPQSNPEEGQPSSIIGQPGAKTVDQQSAAILHQIRCGMRRVLRLQFIRRFPLIFDEELIRQYKNRLVLPSALIHSLRTFVSLSAQHDSSLFTATRDLLEDIDETQDMSLRRKVEATAKVAPKRGPKRRRTSAEGSVSDPEDHGHMDIVTDHLVNLGRREDDDSAIESSIKRALLAIGLADWSCARHGQSKAGAGRITMENTPVPNTSHYDDIRNLTGTSPSPAVSDTQLLQLDNKYKPGTESARYSPNPSRRVLQQQLYDQIQLAMFEPQRQFHPFSSSLPSFSSFSRSSPLPPPAPRSKCRELPFLDDDLGEESDVSEADSVRYEIAHIETHDWSSSLPTPQRTPPGSPALSPIELDAFSAAGNALCLDLYSDLDSSSSSSSTLAFNASLRGTGGRSTDLEYGPGPAHAMLVSRPLEPYDSLGDSDFSDDLSNVMFHLHGPEPSAPGGRGRPAASRASAGPSIRITDEHGGQQTVMTASGRLSPIEPRLHNWLLDRDVAMSTESFEDDLEDDWDAATVHPYDDLSPPGLDEDSDLDSDGPSVDSPQESGVLFNEADPHTKHQGSELWHFAQLEDDLGDGDEVLVTPMEEDAPFALAP